MYNVYDECVLGSMPIRWMNGFIFFLLLLMYCMLQLSLITVIRLNMKTHATPRKLQKIHVLFLSLIISLIETKLKNPIDSQSNQKYLCVYVTEIERKVISFIQNKSENENKMEKLW